MKSVYINRTYYGFGDWVLFGSVIKLINRQRPDLDVHFTLTRLPLWLVQLMSYSDIRAHANINLQEQSKYDYYMTHLVYDPASTHDKHLIESMVDNLNKATGLGLKYEPEVFMQYTGPVLKSEFPTPYVVLPSSGNLQTRSSGVKEWGRDGENFDAVAAALHNEGITTVQTGMSGDRPLRNADRHYLNVSFQRFHSLIVNSAAVVALENGLNHYAGHYRKRTYTLYRALYHTKPVNTWYPNQVPITDELVDPECLGKRIAADVKATQEQEKKKGQEVYNVI